MIDYGGCDKADLIEALESLAYKIIEYRNPGQYEIIEEQIISVLKEEGLLVIKY